jgi:iron complex transport system permease protein
MPQKHTEKWITVILSALLLISVFLSVRVGAVAISYHDIAVYFSHLFNKSYSASSIEEAVFFQIRLPRVLLCVLTGATLSASGAIMQVLFRNPIVEPGLTGTSAGAAFGAAFIFVMGKSLQGSFIHFIGPLLLPVCAFAGALIATFIVYKLSSVFGKTNVFTMLLAGIAVNALANSGTGFFSYIARDPQARSITFWNLGTFSGADWQAVLFVFISTTIGIIICLRFSKALNAMVLGEKEAEYLGINIERIKLGLILINTFMVAIATAFVGVISFIGLVVPHIIRIIHRSGSRFLIINSALLGAVLLNLADMLSRTIAKPSELPIGIITAIAGAPLFLFLLVKNNRQNKTGGFYG